MKGHYVEHEKRLYKCPSRKRRFNFLVQSVKDRIRMIEAYCLVKGLLGKQLKDILVELLNQIKERTKLRVIAWGSNHGIENRGCKKEFIRDEITFLWQLPYTWRPEELFTIIPDAKPSYKTSMGQHASDLKCHEAFG